MPPERRLRLTLSLRRLRIIAYSGGAAPPEKPIAEERNSLDRPEAGERSGEHAHNIGAVDEDLQDLAFIVAENAREVAAGVAGARRRGRTRTSR